MYETVRIGALALCATLAAAPAAQAARVVVFGDSWANQGWDEFAQTFVDRGHPEMTVAEYAVGGTTAEGWAALPDALPDAVAENPDATHVWLSLGGNDITTHFRTGRPKSLRRDNRDNLRIILDALFAAHPDVRVVMFGYDFMNFVDRPECRAEALGFVGLPSPEPPDPFLNTMIALFANLLVLDSTVRVHEEIAGEYANVDFVSIVGTLQRAAGYENAPDLLRPSPFFKDCIHPSSQGFEIVMNDFYDLYWGPLLDGAEPPATGCATAPAGASPWAAAPILGLLAALAARRTRRRGV